MTRLQQMQSQLQKKQKEYFELTAKQTALANKIGSLNMKLNYSNDIAWNQRATKTLKSYNSDYNRMQKRLVQLNTEIAQLRYKMGI